MTSNDGRGPDEPRDGLLRTAPGLLRVAAGASWRALSWTVGAAVSTSTEVARRTFQGEPPAQIIQEVTKDLRTFARQALGVPEQPGRPDPAGSTEDLQALGEQLLRRSADVSAVDEGHPAYARILSELTPDEARILRFLYLNDAQPSIDVRTNRPLGIGSELVAGGLNMIAEHAGCREVDRIHPYLTNLNRLGLVEFSKEQVRNPNRYQLIEAQPKVTAIMREAGRSPRIVRRSIHLNDFGRDFCRTCFGT